MTPTQPACAPVAPVWRSASSRSGLLASVCHSDRKNPDSGSRRLLSRRRAYLTASVINHFRKLTAPPTTARFAARASVAGQCRAKTRSAAKSFEGSGWAKLLRAGRTSHLALIASVFASVFAFASNASAQEATTPGWHFYLTPYLWISGLSGTIGTQVPDAPTHNVTASFGTLLSHLDNIPVMGSFEARNGRFGLSADLMVISIRTPITTPGPLFSGVTAQSSQLLSTELGMYRVLEQKDQWLDLGVGVRTIAVWTKLTFNPGILPGFSQSTSVAWPNPLFAARYHVDLPAKFGLTAYGDVGGVGTNRTWQVLGTVDYRFSDNVTFQAGYRHLHLDWSGSTLQVNLALSGPFLGATFRF